MAKAGQPTKYKEEYCDDLINHMATGLSYESFAADKSVTRDCLYKWEKSNPAFKQAKMIGKEKALLLFEKIGLKAITGGIKNFNAATYIFTMKNKCGWRDNPEEQQAETSKAPVVINISKATVTRTLDEIEED